MFEMNSQKVGVLRFFRSFQVMLRNIFGHVTDVCLQFGSRSRVVLISRNLIGALQLPHSNSL